MSLNRWVKARDANEPQIYEAARKAGYSVVRLDTPCDLVVGKGGRSHLVEVKRPLGPKGGVGGTMLTPAQRRFAKRWKGCLHIVRSPAELLEALRECERIEPGG